MKRFFIVCIVILVGWNIVLTYFLFQGRNESGTNSNQDVMNARTEIASDVSELVTKTENKVVTITTKVFGDKASTGSGAVYKVDGKTVYVITNNHVVDGGQTFVVTYANGSSAEASVVGKDALSDLALLKMDVDFEAEAFVMGDSSLVKKGEYVIAMGSPLGIAYQGSVSGGLISGIDRKVDMDSDGNGNADWDMNVFQIDAAINPGNSGGPLVNMAGELIGINSMKIANTQVEGFGFSIPINEVLPIIEQLEKDGEVKRPILGISGNELEQYSDFEKAYLNIDSNLTDGIVITKVGVDTPAAKAGLQAKDIMISFDQQKIETFKQFRQLLYSKKVGDTVAIAISREGEVINVEVELE